MTELLTTLLVFLNSFTPVAEGKATYYTEKGTGKITASGERFLDEGFTCAMLSGEFGSYYLVVAENSGRSVICKLNDRGPHIKNRLIDLSKAAMRELHNDEGTVRVKVYYLGKEVPPIVHQMQQSNQTLVKVQEETKRLVRLASAKPELKPVKKKSAKSDLVLTKKELPATVPDKEDLRVKQKNQQIRVMTASTQTNKELELNGQVDSKQ